MIFENILTALITPFKNDRIDYSSLEKLIHRQIDAGIGTVIAGGSTGEGNSLSEDEYFDLIAKCVDFAGGNIQVVAGLAGVSTNYVCDKINQLSQLKIDGLMCTTPHYIKPEQEGLYRHFAAVSEISKVPIMVYINPGRTGCDLSDDIILKISAFEQIKAIKDCSNDLEKPLRLHGFVKEDLNFLTGDDSRLLAYSANGGKGCVSVLSNIFPKLCLKINQYCRLNDFKSALNLQQELMIIIGGIFSESNPIGIKCAAELLKLCDGEIRIPLTKANNSTARKIQNSLDQITVLENNVRL